MNKYTAILLLGVSLGLLGLLLHAESSTPRTETKIIELRRQQIGSVPMAKMPGGTSYLQVVYGSTAKFAELTRYTSADGLMTASVKKFEPLTLDLIDWPFDEFMYFTSGRVEITDSTGTVRRYGKGDAIVIPKGFTGRWRQLSSIEMLTVTRTYKN